MSLLFIKSTAATAAAAAILPTLFNFPGKSLKVISSNHTWLTYGCGKKFMAPISVTLSQGQKTTEAGRI